MTMVIGSVLVLDATRTDGFCAPCERQTHLFSLNRKRHENRKLTFSALVSLEPKCHQPFLAVPSNHKNYVRVINDSNGYDATSLAGLTTRRHFLKQAARATTLVSAVSLPLRPALAEPSLFQRETKDFSYVFDPPPGMAPGNKPLKTHLDEVNFFPAENDGNNDDQPRRRRGYQYGITVDPVRIPSLTDFGTPEEAAAKVVLAEVNRDGITNVKLMEDPKAGRAPLPTLDNADSNGDDASSSSLSSSSMFYQLNYLSQGSRGDKRFVTKFYIVNQKLFALTAQCKEADYDALEREMLTAVDSFRVIR